MKTTPLLTLEAAVDAYDEIHNLILERFEDFYEKAQDDWTNYEPVDVWQDLINRVRFEFNTTTMRSKFDDRTIDKVFKKKKK